MGISRYSSTPRLSLGTQLGTTRVSSILRQGIEDNRIRFTTITLRGNQRLDTISHEVYGDASYWWVIAAASNIGWPLQVPPDTQLVIPNLEDVLGFVLIGD